MKLIKLIIYIISFLIILGCGEKKEIKPEENPQIIEKKTELETKKEYNPMEDTSFENVMRVLREWIDKEKKSQDSETKLNTAKAYILVIKFLNTDKEKVKKSGMTEEDIKFLKDNAKDQAKSRLQEIITNPSIPQNMKKEAQDKLSELLNL